MCFRLVVPVLAATLVGAPALAQSSAVSQQPKMLLHGNYCGPGNNAPLAPIDALDAACARHDACTPDGALPSKACNLRLQRDAELISRDPRQPDDLRTTAGFVAAGATMLPYDPSIAPTPVVAPAAAINRPYGTDLQKLDASDDEPSQLDGSEE